MASLNRETEKEGEKKVKKETVGTDRQRQTKNQGLGRDGVKKKVESGRERGERRKKREEEKYKVLLKEAQKRQRHNFRLLKNGKCV